MKKALLPLTLFVLALLVAIGSQTFLGACVHEDGCIGACHWASRMLLGVGSVQAALALLALALPAERRGLYLAMAPVAILGLLTPGPLISICMSNAMRCRMLMKPAMTILCALSLAGALAGWLLERRKKG